MKVIKIKFIQVLAAFFILTTAVWAQTNEFTYQGKLSDSGTATATYDFEFRLCDAKADCAAPLQIKQRLAVPVAGGAFSVRLDFDEAHFNGDDRWLEIAVKRPDQKNFTTLDVRQKITSAPYSIKSKSAVEANNAAQLGGVVASEYVTTSTIGNTFIKNDVMQQTADFNVSGNGILGGALQATEVRAQTPTGTYGLTQTDGTTTVSTYVGNSSSGATGGWFGTRSNSPLFLFTNSGQPTMTLTGGNVGVGTVTPQSRITVQTSTFNPYGFTHTNGTVTLGTYIDAAGGWFGTRSDNPLHFFTNNGIAQMTILQNGSVGIGTNTPLAGTKLDVNGAVTIRGGGSTGGGFVNFGSPNAETGMSINGNGTTRADLRFDGTTMKLLAGTGLGPPSSTNGIAVNISGNVGIGTTNPTSKLEVVGTMKTGVLQITGGSDLAENFEITGGAKPGMVVAIDPRQTGKLTVARGVYNRRVAGIVSGANNLSVGMILPDLKDTKNSLPVALSGRVWVYCDATRNPIRAGDLLTTSATPGYAMKVVNYSKAQGAIIGKAMTDLKSGKGLVLVLVTLQ